MARTDLSRSWMARSARVARLGARVGGTYAGTAARKVFASTERRIELDERVTISFQSHQPLLLGPATRVGIVRSRPRQQSPPSRLSRSGIRPRFPSRRRPGNDHQPHDEKQNRQRQRQLKWGEARSVVASF